MLLDSFNSTLVRFKWNEPLLARDGRGVSIPHWFDSSRVRRVNLNRLVNEVSIPHWFDSSLVNKQLANAQMEVGFNSTLVRFK